MNIKILEVIKKVMEEFKIEEKELFESALWRLINRDVVPYTWEHSSSAGNMYEGHVAFVCDQEGVIKKGLEYKEYFSSGAQEVADQEEGDPETIREQIKSMDGYLVELRWNEHGCFYKIEKIKREAA